MLSPVTLTLVYYRFSTQNYLILYSPVTKNPSEQIFLPQSGQNNRIFPYPKSVCEKRVFSLDNSANPMKSK
jgi:hypothetical protein